IPRHAQFVRLFFLACVVYFTSTMLDTFDVWAHARLTAWAAGAQATSPLIFSDFWYPLYAPRQFMNDLEEVFENLAAVLFAGSFLLLWVEKRALFTSPEKRFSRTAMILGLLLVVVGGGALFWSGVHVFSSRETSPAIAVAAQPIVRATDGLFHTDDLSWHDGWGLIIANEGGKNVLRYWPPTAHRAPLADPERLLKDPDSITATDRGIFVSDGTRRSIFRFSEGKGWEKFLTKKDGLDRPEGLAVNGDVMYVVDETARALYFVTLSKREVRKIPITQKKLRTPEGITIHPELGVLITDDTTGYIVRFTLGGEPTVFADPSDGLRNPEGITVDAQGNIWVTDNGRREIIAFSKDGSVIRRMKFQRMYSDLQGIAWGKDARGQDTLYVVTADGYGSSSFIPSTVWEIR
ncbi:SMP-30/gluconolactonase/LRE family protein, partial [Candidatus Uhrbacteria bacterium]|nr:SMP-30/gluconolactonase/LRE family protein [Candidatus Uhrbacteria bacterium]